MTSPMLQTGSNERLRASPNFVLAFTFDGRPYVAQETEPYIQYWLTERYRILLSMFSRRRGATVADAIEGCLRLSGAPDTPAERKRLAKAAADMRAAGVLVGAGDDVSRYDETIVADYLAYRPFPRELAELIVGAAPITRDSRVLDLAGGPGDLALALAQSSDHVSLMELSRGFLTAAARRAKRLGRALTPLHDSCNRLVFRDEPYDVVTVAQALHWLDDVMVCRGLCRALRPGGSFFVIHSAIEVDDAHPLGFVLGNRSVLGHKPERPFVDEVRPLWRRLGLLFDALDAPDVHRVDPTQQWTAPASGSQSRIVPAGVSLFRQRRPYGPGYARAFLTQRHIEATGRTPAAFWGDIEARCAAAGAEQLLGTHHWAVLQFRRGGDPVELPPLESLTIADIGYDGRAEDTRPVVNARPATPSSQGDEQRVAALASA